MPIPATELERFKELDGLRGIAILLVICFHCRFIAAPQSFPGYAYYGLAQIGWVGVDLFFVLSGFLITRILLTTLKEPNYFRNFYTRRILRIFPLYYTTLAVVFVVSRLPNSPALFMQPSGVAEASYWFHFQNWLQLLTHTQTPILGAFWTLAIEEQFYFVWPAVVLFAARNQQLERLCVVVWLTTTVFRIWYVEQGYEGAYHITITRLDGLLLGAYVAANLVHRGSLDHLRPLAVRMAIYSGLVIVIIRVMRAGFSGNDPIVLQYGLPAIAILFSSILVLAMTSETNGLFRKVLRNKALCFIGVISFAMYVFHPAVIAFIDHLGIVPTHNFWMAHVMLLSLAIGATMILAWLSYTYFERPLMDLRPRLLPQIKPHYP